MLKNTNNTENTKETVQHGTVEFPLQVYKDLTYYKEGLILYNHWHEEAEILYILEGELEIVIDEISIFAEKGTIILIPPNTLHAAYQSKSKKGSFTSIVFHTDFIDSKYDDIIKKEHLLPFFQSNFISSYIIKSTDKYNQIVLFTLKEFITAYENHDPFREILIKGYLYQILFYLLQKQRKYSIKSTMDFLNEERQKTVLTYIHENYQNPITLLELANTLNLSKEQFCRFFKRSFRETPINYLNQYRVTRSMELLAQTDLPIIDIALRVGFDSGNYFAIVFKKINGLSPTEYRASQNNLTSKQN